MDSGNLLLTVLYITVMKTSESSQSSACDPGWNHFGASCYLFSSTTQTWEEAKVSCEGLNSYLAEIETSEENEELTRIAKQQVVVGADQGWWIGATDMTTEGTFIWNNSGSLLSYEDWGTAQPDDAGPANYYNCDCLRIADYLIQINNPKVWTDFKCTFDNYYICERDVECLGDKNVENAIVGSYSGNSVNDVVLYTCVPGFELTDGSLTRTCTENGTWSDRPVCSSAVCECLCSSTTHYSILSQEQLEEKIQRMHSELVVSKNDTSKFKRSKISAPDDRVTAKTTGFVLGFGLLTALFAFIVISDITSYHRFSQQCAFKRD